MGRPPCCDKVGIKKGPWTPEEDIILVSYIQEHGPGNWRAVPTNTGLMRCSKSCRLRWTNYLRPGIKRGNFTPHEEGMIIHLQALLGNKWAAIATYLPQRTDNDIKNYWNTHLKKKLKKFQSGGCGLEPPHNKMASESTSNCHKFMSKGYGSDVENEKHRAGGSSVYASSEENISRLLEGWMRSSPSPLPFNAATTTITTTNSNLMMAASRDHEFGKIPVETSSIQCYGPQQVETEATTDRMNMINHHHHHDHDLESILSFDHRHGLMASCHDQKSSCDSSKGSESSGGGLMMDHECAQFEHKPPKLEATTGSGNPPLSFLEKWLLDESAGQVEGVMELPPIF